MKRHHHALLVLSTIALGLGSRRPGWPEAVYLYVGDALYASMIYFGTGTVAPARPRGWRWLVAVAFCFGIEFSQLSQAGFLVWARSFHFGRLILGQGFVGSDLLCYLVGASLAASFEIGWTARQSQNCSQSTSVKSESDPLKPSSSPNTGPGGGLGSSS